MAAGDILACRIASATAHNGWVAEIDIDNLATGGTYAFGLGTNNDPSAAKVVFSVTSSGYDATGGSTTRVRTIYGTQAVRQPYPNPSLADESTSGATLTVRVALSDVIYSGDTSITVTIGSGLYTKTGTPSNATTALSVTNNSTLAYSVARVIGNWTTPQWTRITGNAITLGAVAFHRHAMNGKPLAAMVFTVSDAHSHTATATVTAMTVDTLVAKASGCPVVLSYQATIDITSFTDGDAITAHFKAYPWVGDSGSIMDTSDAVNTHPTPLYAKQTYYLDRSGRTSVAVVDVTSGNDATGAAVAESAFNPASPPAACATINKAIALINARNNSTYSVNDAAGTVYMQAGNYPWTGASNSISATAGRSWCTLTPFPGVSGSSVVITSQSGDQAAGGTPLKLDGIAVNVSGGPVSVFNSCDYMWFANLSTFDSNGTAPIYQVKNYAVTGCSGLGALVGGFKGFGGVSSSPSLVRGNDLAGMTAICALYTLIGNTVSASTTVRFNSEYSGQVIASTQPIAAFNTFYHLTSSSDAVLALLQTVSSPLGAAIVQNIVENNYTTSTQALISAAEGSSTGTPINNVMLWHNTIVGGRINRAYNETGTVSKVRTAWSEVGEIRDEEAIKSDTFPTASANRVGNWPVLYGVGRFGCVNAETDAGSPGFAAAGQFQMEFEGISTYSPTVTAGATQPPTSTTNGLTFLDYVSRAAFDGTNAGSGGGNYQLGSSSPARTLMPSAVLPFDIAGTARSLTGGSSGAYEMAVAAVLTGTAIGGITEADVVAGGKTIIATLTGDTFIAN